MLRAFLCFLGSLLIAPVAALAQQASPSDERLEGLDADIASMVERYEAPGLAVAVIENGEIIYTHYSGQSDIAAGQAVNGQTQFGIGSVVKSFTSGLIGTLADEGKLSLDAHPRSYLPGFPESDVPEGKRLAIRHLLTQSSGLPKMDGSLAYFVPSKRREILPRVAEFDRGCAPAVCFEYNNLNFMILDAVAESVSGKSKAQLLKDRLLNPIGMTDTLATTAAFEQSPNAAQGYLMVDGVPQPTATENLLGEQIYATAADLARWLGVWMNEGRLGEAQVLPADYVARATTMQAIDDGAPPSPDNPGVYLFGYGHAWFVKSVNGQYVVHHGGNENGFSTHTLFVPALGFGVVALTNQQGSILPNLVTDTVLHRMAELPITSIETYPLVVQAGRALLSQDDAKLAINPEAPIDIDVEALMGTYSANGYGEMTVELEYGVLTLHTPTGPFVLVHESERTFLVESTKPLRSGINLGYFKVSFGEGEKVDSLDFNIAAEPVTFQRVTGGG